MKYIKHLVVEMDESMVQRCLICGSTISDYRNTMWPSGQNPPTGYPAGEVFVSFGTNPTISCTELGEGETSENCKA